MINNPTISTASMSRTREVVCKAVFTDTNGTNTTLTGSNIIDFTIKEGVCASSLTMGSTISAQLKIKIKQPTPALTLTGGTVVPYIGFKVGGVNTFTPRGKYYITDVKKSITGDVVDITAYDGFVNSSATYTAGATYHKNGTVYPWSSPKKMDEILYDVCHYCGVDFNPEGCNTDVPGVDFTRTIISLPTGTLRDWIGWIAGYSGGNAKFDENGKLVFRWFTDVYGDDRYRINQSRQHMNGVAFKTESEKTVNSITCYTGKNTIIHGSGEGFSFENPFMTTARLSSIYDRAISYQDFYHRPCTVKWRGDPCAEAGDIMWCDMPIGGQAYVFIMEQTITVNGGLYANITCHGQDTEKNSFSSSTTTSKEVTSVVGKIASGDCVIEQGQTGNITWRKYDSGVAECWGSCLLLVSAWNTWGSLYESSTSTFFTYPSGLFSQSPTVFASSGGALGSSTLLAVEQHTGGTAQRSPDLYAIRPTSVSAQPFNINIHAIGRWD